MKSQMIVRLVGDQWMVEEFESTRRARIISLFGTAEICTPFTASMPAAEVIKRLQALNSGADITVGIAPQLTEAQRQRLHAHVKRVLC